MKIFRKFCKCLKINAKFWERCAIFGTLNLWNFFVKYYKTFIQRLEEKSLKILPYSIGHILPLCYQFYIFTFWCLFLIWPHAAPPLPEPANYKWVTEYFHKSIFFKFKNSIIKTNLTPRLLAAQRAPLAPSEAASWLQIFFNVSPKFSRISR